MTRAKSIEEIGVNVMDLMIEASLLEVVNVLRAVGFRDIDVRDLRIIEAKMRDGWGGYTF